MNKRIGVTFLAALTLFMQSDIGLADSSEDWIRRASNATTALAQGNSQAAAYQAVPTTNIPLPNQAYLNAGLSGASLQQRIAPLDQFSSKYLGVDGSYSLRSNYGPNRFPTVSNDVQVSTRNPLFTNTTTFTPKFRRNN